MAMLEHETTKQRYLLRAVSIIGRGPTSDVQLPERHVSLVHAEIRWDGQIWLIQDLQSRNGTLVSERALAPNERRPIGTGDRLAFGAIDDRWVVLDLAPPEVLMVRLADYAPLRPEAGVIALPSAGQPLAMVFEAYHGQWAIEMNGEMRLLHDGDEQEVSGERYRFFQPYMLAETTDLSVARPIELANVTLRFSVTRDEKRVGLTIIENGQVQDLGVRSCFGLLLALARRKLSDVARGRRPEEQGWMSFDDLSQILDAPENQINTDVFRIRQSLGRARMHEAAGIIERRSRPRELRITIRNLEVQPWPEA